MAKKTEEVQELVVLTDEQVNALPKVVKDNVVFLTDNMHKKDLMVLNPLVSELINLRELGSSLKIKPADEDGNFDKTNIQEFVDVKKAVRTFRAEVKRAGKTLRDPYIAIQKGVVAIEKAIVDEATKVYDDAEKEFKPYLDAEAEKERLKQEEKDRALLEQVEASKKAEEETRKQLAVSQAYNTIKFYKIGEFITNKTNQVVVDGNETALYAQKDKVKLTDFQTLCHNVENYELLDQHLVTELLEAFNKARANALKLIEGAITAMELEREKMRQQAVIETMKDKPPQALNQESSDGDIDTIPKPPGQALLTLSVDEFKAKISIESERLLSLANLYIANNPHSYPTLRDVKKKLEELTQILKE